MRLFLAFRTFFAVLFRGDIAEKIRVCLEKPASITVNGSSSTTTAAVPIGDASNTAAPKPSSPTKSKPSPRSEALTLLSALQREARLLDLVCESLDQYSDAQIGAAARDVLRDTKKTLDRMFAISPLVDSQEGESIELPNVVSPVRWRVIGKESSTNAVLSHRGWQATKIDMPQWSGNADDALIIAAAEVES